LIDEIERYFEKHDRTYDTQKLVIWLSNKKENPDNIEDNVASLIVLITQPFTRLAVLPWRICPPRRSVH
jgi:hypothetical protein